MTRFQEVSVHKRFLYLVSLLLALLFIVSVGIYLFIHSRKTEMIAYPEDFLTIHGKNPSGNDAENEPYVYESGEGADGPFRIVYYNYNSYSAYEKLDPYSGWRAINTVYNDDNYVTSEGISVGSNKKDVINAYEKYGLREYNLSKITSLNIWSLDILLHGVDLADTFLYVDNQNVFDAAYPGTDYWGGLGALVFILDQNDRVVKIGEISPTSG
ncbi:MAG: hypothetical protein FWC55_02440 [Firmicutes bacterium]|nr:hypothetical protein [Bacillota bacterium]